jgi:hypothetical protein
MQPCREVPVSGAAFFIDKKEVTAPDSPVERLLLIAYEEPTVYRQRLLGIIIAQPERMSIFTFSVSEIKDTFFFILDFIEQTF